MRRRAVLLAMMTAACGKTRKPPPPLVWFDDVDLAYAEARRSGKPVFLYFGATWDCASKQLEHGTFPDPDVGGPLYDWFVCARIDCSDDEDETTQRLTRAFYITGTPALLVTDETRRELWRETMYMKPTELAPVLRAARARHYAMRDIDEGMRLATAWRRPVILLFAPAYDLASWKVRRDCFGDRNVVDRIRGSFVFVDVPCDEGSDDGWRRFGVRGSPTSIIVDGATGAELARVEELVGPRVYERFLDMGLARHRA